MKATPKSVLRTYLTLTLLTTLSASFIWGINTLFLLDAGLSNLEAFSANAFFTVGMVLFEVPTGVLADIKGRRASFLVGCLTLLVSTLLYLLMWQISAPFWGWALSSLFIGLGFTFFSGAVEAWLVDCLQFVKYKGSLDSVFAKGQIVGGIAMLSGSILGGVIAQFTNLGVPYIVRSAVLAITFVVAFILMKDLGFQPTKSKNMSSAVKSVINASIQHGWKNPPVRNMMLAMPFIGGVGIFAFYAMQPYLLELYGDPSAYSIAGLAAAIIAGAQVFGGLSVSIVRKLFKRRTSIILVSSVLSAIMLFAIGITNSFALAVIFLILWAVMSAMVMPVRQAYLNGLIPSAQRATVLSFDSLMNSSGGIVTQPLLGRAADVWSYSSAYVISAGIHALSIPFIVASRNNQAISDKIIKQMRK